jgi:hypothetical protein
VSEKVPNPSTVNVTVWPSRRHAPVGFSPWLSIEIDIASLVIELHGIRALRQGTPG